MLDERRLSRVIEKMTTDYLLITDPVSIAYLCGKKIEPGERFLGLLIGKGIEPVLILNQLFRFSDAISVRVEYYKDTDTITNIISQFIDKNGSLGVDKIMPARFLIPMMEAKIAAEFKLGSYAVDHTRAIKDAREQELMRTASHVNDLAMAEFKKLIHDGVTEVEVALPFGVIRSTYPTYIAR